MCVHVQVRRQLGGVGSLLVPGGAWKWSLGCQACLQAPLPTEPSCLPPTCLFLPMSSSLWDQGGTEAIGQRPVQKTRFRLCVAQRAMGQAHVCWLRPSHPATLLKVPFHPRNSCLWHLVPVSAGPAPWYLTDLTAPSCLAVVCTLGQPGWWLVGQTVVHFA